jgi:hypothetical protein
MRQDSVEKAHNTHIWAEEHPRAIKEHIFQQLFSFNIWGRSYPGATTRPSYFITASIFDICIMELMHDLRILRMWLMFEIPANFK